MSLFDSLPKGSQVKLWECCMTTYKVGDTVPEFYPEYVVLLVEGGFVKVKNGIITKIVENKHRKCYFPEDFPGVPCLDKWGGLLKNKQSLEGISLMGNNYYWWR